VTTSVRDANGAEYFTKLYSGCPPVAHVHQPVECSQQLLRHLQGHGLLPLAEALNQPRQPPWQLRVAPSGGSPLFDQEVLKIVDEVLNWVVFEAAFAKVHPGACNEGDRTVSAQYSLENWNHSSNFGPVSVRKANCTTCIPEVGEEEMLDEFDEILLRVPTVSGVAPILIGQNALRDDGEQLQGGLRNRRAVRHIVNQIISEPATEACEGLVIAGHDRLEKPPCTFLYRKFQCDARQESVEMTTPLEVV
jgi:hypothetical protein